MKPNIFLLTIDSLRHDHIDGKRKSAKTPNLDSLIQNGMYFRNNISSSDQTGTSLASIFTGKYPINSGITQFNFNFEFTTFFDKLKNLGYNLNSCITDLVILKKIVREFDHNLEYTYAEKNAYPHLDDGLGKKILDILSKQKESKPWIFYCHLMDLKNPEVSVKIFDDKEYGNTPYDRNLSILDIWIGKFLKCIDMSNTIFIITSDHGEYIKSNVNELEKSIRDISKIGKKFSALESIGKKPFAISLKLAKKIQQGKTDELTPFEKRNYFLERAGGELYDDLFKVPLIISGFNINKGKTISKLVRHIDIFPIIFELGKLPLIDNTIDGKSDLDSDTENYAYIESGSKSPKIEGKTIGIRTKKWKYFRSRQNSNENIKLFDLENDPKEENNILDEKIIRDMEEELRKIIAESKLHIKNEISEEDANDMEEELRKMGYID